SRMGLSAGPRTKRRAISWIVSGPIERPSGITPSMTGAPGVPGLPSGGSSGGCGSSGSRPGGGFSPGTIGGRGVDVLGGGGVDVTGGGDVDVNGGAAPSKNRPRVVDAPSATENGSRSGT